MQNDDIVSSWRSGADSVDGLQNPAGPLYVEGEAATVAAMMNPDDNIISGTLTAITCRPGTVGCCNCY
jgi:ribosomal protein S8E